MVKLPIRTVVGAAAGLALALGALQPATAAEPDPGGVPPAAQAWLQQETSLTVPLVDKTQPLSPDATIRKVPRPGGARLTHYRGSFLMWTENDLEWYWSATKITSSTGWQQVGYIFPNTARKGGIQRTYKGVTQHNWRGTNYAGAGIVTPWGDVNVYQAAKTDYYALKRGGGATVN
ncbi:hypothetical protein [Glaciihabitans sp. dw_435]|uniref:hypothetical protein n=1 Tax=Glaciihabitans sp. dw_435 TaxID=2720081 RepID=UPI001BD517F9|nr:hypothetical protein [Glaciihabitans sp. dw_435]